VYAGDWALSGKLIEGVIFNTDFLRPRPPRPFPFVAPRRPATSLSRSRYRGHPSFFVLVAARHRRQRHLSRFPRPSQFKESRRRHPLFSSALPSSLWRKRASPDSVFVGVRPLARLCGSRCVLRGVEGTFMLFQNHFRDGPGRIVTHTRDSTCLASAPLAQVQIDVQILAFCARYSWPARVTSATQEGLGEIRLAEKPHRASFCLVHD